MGEEIKVWMHGVSHTAGIWGSLPLLAAWAVGWSLVLSAPTLFAPPYVSFLHLRLCSQWRLWIKSILLKPGFILYSMSLNILPLKVIVWLEMVGFPGKCNCADGSDLNFFSLCDPNWEQFQEGETVLREVEGPRDCFWILLVQTNTVPCCLGNISLHSKCNISVYTAVFCDDTYEDNSVGTSHQ